MLSQNRRICVGLIYLEYAETVFWKEFGLLGKGRNAFVWERFSFTQKARELRSFQEDFGFLTIAGVALLWERFWFARNRQNCVR